MYDVLIIGAGPGGIFTAYELMERRPDLKVAVFETGHRSTAGSVRLTARK